MMRTLDKFFKAINFIWFDGMRFDKNWWGGIEVGYLGAGSSASLAPGPDSTAWLDLSSEKDWPRASSSLIFIFITLLIILHICFLILILILILISVLLNEESSSLSSSPTTWDGILIYPSGDILENLDRLVTNHVHYNGLDNVTLLWRDHYRCRPLYIFGTKFTTDDYRNIAISCITIFWIYFDILIDFLTCRNWCPVTVLVCLVWWLFRETFSKCSIQQNKKKFWRNWTIRVDPPMQCPLMNKKTYVWGCLDGIYGRLEGVWMVSKGV